MTEQKPDKLKTCISDLNLRNPTMLAAGILGSSSDTLREVAQAGAGALVTKSVGLKPRICYSNPTVIQVECGLLNAVGLPNPGIYKFSEEIKELKDLEIPLISSIYGFTAEEYLKVATIAIKSGADAVELNLSCPHVKGSGAEIGQNPQMVKEIVKKVKTKIRKPVFAKLTPNVANISDLAEAAASAGVNGVTAINTVKAMAINIETHKPILANRIGGLSGGAIKPVAVRCVYEIYEKVKVPLIGCGGIRSWKDAVEFFLAGASAIQIGSAIAFEDLNVFNSVTKGISKYLKKNGYRSVGDLVGLAHSR
jgi:dihydroorotate dehydrogenase (NAD+) catalytic subunit